MEDASSLLKKPSQLPAVDDSIIYHELLIPVQAAHQNGMMPPAVTE
jgi:hypothetical protein